MSILKSIRTALIGKDKLKVKPLTDLVKKKSSTGIGNFVDLNNDLGLMVEGLPHHDPGILMPYLYARRTAAAGMFHQGAIDKQAFDQVEGLFFNLMAQIGSGLTKDEQVKFQEDSLSRAQELEAKYLVGVNKKSISLLVAAAKRGISMRDALLHAIDHGQDDLEEIVEPAMCRALIMKSEFCMGFFATGRSEHGDDLDTTSKKVLRYFESIGIAFELEEEEPDDGTDDGMYIAPIDGEMHLADFETFHEMQRAKYRDERLERLADGMEADFGPCPHGRDELVNWLCEYGERLMLPGAPKGAAAGEAMNRDYQAWIDQVVPDFALRRQRKALQPNGLLAIVKRGDVSNWGGFYDMHEDIAGVRIAEAGADSLTTLAYAHASKIAAAGCHAQGYGDAQIVHSAAHIFGSCWQSVKPSSELDHAAQSLALEFAQSYVEGLDAKKVEGLFEMASRFETLPNLMSEHGYLHSGFVGVDELLEYLDDADGLDLSESDEGEQCDHGNDRTPEQNEIVERLSELSSRDSKKKYKVHVNPLGDDMGSWHFNFSEDEMEEADRLTDLWFNLRNGDLVVGIFNIICTTPETEIAAGSEGKPKKVADWDEEIPF